MTEKFLFKVGDVVTIQSIHRLISMYNTKLTIDYSADHSYKGKECTILECYVGFESKLKKYRVKINDLNLKLFVFEIDLIQQHKVFTDKEYTEFFV